MCKPSQYINDICNNCHPQSYEMTPSKFAGQENIVEASNPDDSYAEYLYECCQCGERVWVDEQWIKRNAVDAPKTIQQRQLYINHKMGQLDTITDVHKYTRRLSRIMRYHMLLTNVESNEIKRILK